MTFPSNRQREAIEAELGPVLVIAGPGAGKTSCLVARIDHLIRVKNFAPGRLCAVTFTNKAAEEIARRLKHTLGRDAEEITRGTIHSLCLSILRNHGADVGLQAGFGVADEAYQHTILARILQAAIPVCAGISLEYYFSTVDPEGYGCGSKLPHNITSLLGVMSGAASDMRPGLSFQMIEIHEALRQLFVIETSPDAMLEIMDRNETIGRLIRNDWVQLATLDPDSSRIHLFRKNRFEVYQPASETLPIVGSSLEWYRGWRDHLQLALVRATSPVDSGES